MASFRKEILGQIERIDTGRIFTFRDLSFEMEKTANVAVLLSEQSRKGVLVRVEKGAYYRPKKSVLGLGKLPVYQDEQFRYLTEKLNGYITGAYVYNKMGLTEQVATTITIATPNPVRRFRFKNLDIECVKAYSMDYPDESLVPYLRLLDAIKDMKRIPGTTGQDIYNRVKSQYFNGYSLPELEKIVSLADAAIALPGGVGTLEELCEVITWKQLGLFLKPIVILNVGGYYDPLLAMLESAARGHFMRPEHLKLWRVARDADEAVEEVLTTPLWDKSIGKFAQI